jgi:hypothetical protein
MDKGEKWGRAVIPTTAMAEAKVIYFASRARD